MIDVAAYALLKRGISTAGTGTGATITDAKIENGELILIMSDGTTVNAGKLPTGAGIDDSIVSTETTWSSEKIVEHTTLNEDRIAEIALEVTERALSEFVPEFIVGGSALESIAYIKGGAASNDEEDILYGMDADEEPVGVKFNFEEE